ncbi:hypothetical protein DICSQDRAFT_174070 [Dichomitus squalens LYAD-421 SS1]|uniref:Uncharacterized protein n=1 Tax=Dichomitus squalens (strain LYAD-421) TaxID=732165 RepID=R7SMC5_DICSQ|nr:uncharacterized protein DICSQDRAFT_174070 [Dichomitus squalens LYAD-421 SS1]EJF57309.1 hypothetical protein DICSQDRAFT_174070 [Dichomitus squalens LYAD-421 SS1]
MFPNNDLLNSSHPSPSNPPTMQSLALPVEVIEGIIDRCSDHTKILLAFALTCHDLHPRSILVLFTDVRPRSRKKLFDLCDVLKAKPERQPFILPYVDEEFTKSLLGIGPPVTPASLPTLNRHQTSPTLPQLSDGTYEVSFTLQIDASTDEIKRAVEILAGPVAMKISTVTVFLRHDDHWRRSSVNTPPIVWYSQ